jgi:iron complex outermembrane receptor protein
LYSNGLHHGAAAIEIGDRKLTKEIVYNVQLGIEYKSNIAKLNLSVFYNYFDGYINLQPSFPPVLTIVGAFPVFNYRQSNVQLYGFNGQMDIPITRYFAYTLQGSVLFADDLTYKKPVFGIPANRITQRLRFTLPIKKTAWKTFVELEGVNVSKQKRMANEDDYAPAPEGYFLLNGQIGLSKKMKGEQTMQLVVACQNSTNTRYRDYMNRFRYFADDLGRNWTVKLLLPIQSNKLK